MLHIKYIALGLAISEQKMILKFLLYTFKENKCTPGARPIFTKGL
jgi:hypothetical protein